MVGIVVAVEICGVCHTANDAEQTKKPETDKFYWSTWMMFTASEEHVEFMGQNQRITCRVSLCH